MKKLLITALLLLLGTGTVFAADNDFDFAGIANSTFGTAVREAGLLTAYRAVAPAEPGGLTGFDIGIEASFAEFDEQIWDQILVGNDTPSYVVAPRLHLRKGLPFLNIDLGASYAYLPDSDVKMYGGEVQWAILEGTAATPALALRGHYSKLDGVDDFSLDTYGADVVLSKGFAIFTPYIGGGVLQINGKYTGDQSTFTEILTKQDFTEYRGFGGCQITMALVRLTLEAEFSEMPVYTAKLSLGW